MKNSHERQAAIVAVLRAHDDWTKKEAALHHAIRFAVSRGVSTATLAKILGINESAKAS